MFEVCSLFLRLFLLIGIKLSDTLFGRLCQTGQWFAQWMIQWPLWFGALFLQAIGSLVNQTLRLPFRPKFRAAKKVGLVILTRLPVAEQAAVSVKEQGASDHLLLAIKQPALFERILVELTTNCVVHWLTAYLPAKWVVPHLYLVHHRTYTSAFTLNGWLSILPNHLVAKQWYEARPALESSKHSSSETNALTSPELPRERSSSILSMARFNANQRSPWEDPTTYYSSRMFDQLPNDHLAQEPFFEPHLSTSIKKTVHNVTVNYVSVPGLGFSALLEVGLRAALRSNCDYVIVLNPRALGLRPEHLSIATQLLSGRSTKGKHVDRVDIVLGITKPYFQLMASKTNSSRKLSGSPLSLSHTISSSPVFASPTGLYLLGIRGGQSLTLQAHSLTNAVEWCTSTVAGRLWANLTRNAIPWTVVCLRERLEELMQPPDLLALETHIGIPPGQFLEDKITVIISMGPGHPDDCLDAEEDSDLIYVSTSRALDSTLELMVHNASGSRAIEIIIIHSGPISTFPLSSSPTESFQFGRTRLRPRITVSLHQYGGVDESDTTTVPPKRGELIRYAVDNLAKGSILVFVDPGVQLPVNWDSAVFHSLQRPGIGMGCFAYRLHLHEKYINRKSIKWAVNSWLANYFVNVQTRWSELPIVGQPCFIYTHYLACLGGYPRSSRALHSIDLATACHRHLGRVVVTRFHTAAAGVPAAFALRHGTFRTAIYSVSIALARYFGASEDELEQMLTANWRGRRGRNGEYQPIPRHVLPLVQPHYLDGY
ncbi:hypothetical protein CSKR_104471 [Clonorchis sinensis]|uniref:Uncharacterized protein n=2 Tax=Clonorchis sinensis TaxID=79923 RepID=A0A8T1LZW6_CLOSI|nr:hypothetical protein CSKR_104471 [Clonorchis sinensis]